MSTSAMLTLCMLEPVTLVTIAVHCKTIAVVVVCSNQENWHKPQEDVTVTEAGQVL